MREKGEMSQLLQNFIIMVKNQFCKDVKIIRSDNRYEFKSQHMKIFYSKKELFIKPFVPTLLNKMDRSKGSIGMFSI